MAKLERLAYCAGLLDGEGCITIKRSRVNHHRKSVSYIFSLCVEMADPRPVRFFCSTFGLKLNLNASRNLKNPAKHRKLYVAQSGAKRGVAILKALLPWMQAKQDEAKLAVEFYEKTMLAFPHRLRGLNRRPTPDWLLEMRHNYYLNLQALKRRSFQEPQGEPDDSPVSETAW